MEQGALSKPVIQWWLSLTSIISRSLRFMTAVGVCGASLQRR